MKIKFIADSAADLPENILDKFDIDLFPLYVNHEDRFLKDGLEMSPEKLYAGMRNGEAYKTSQVSVNDFLLKFKEYAKKDEKVIYIAFSSELSGTFQSAVLAKKQLKEEYPDFDLTIIDSRCASLGVGLSIYHTIKAAEEIDEKNKIVEKAKYYTEHMEHIFTVDDLKYLVRGGRVSKVTGIVGGILDIKPVLEVENGKLVPLEKKKGRKRALKRIVELIGERGSNLSEQKIAISHGDDLKGAKKLQEMISNEYNCDSFLINTVGAVIGAHSGPGTLAVFFINDNKEGVNVTVR